MEFEFIFGAGSQGLCPFEFQLAHKKEGDSLSLRVRGRRSQTSSSICSFLPEPYRRAPALFILR